MNTTAKTLDSCAQNARSEILTLMLEGKNFGTVAVRENNARENDGRRIIGDFSRGVHYDEFAPLCEAVIEWGEQFAQSSRTDYDGDMDPYWAWDKWVEAMGNLAAIYIVELAKTVEEFCIDRDGGVVIFV